MSEVCFEQGVVLGFGGTNARVGVIDDGNLLSHEIEPTPEHPDEFFRWMAQRTLDAADAGAEWAVAGFPGPVSRDGSTVGPMVNVPGLSRNSYDLRTMLTETDPAFARLTEQGFGLYAVNDGELAAQAAASRVDSSRFASVAALIIGTGVGAGIVRRDAANPNVYRADETPSEIGHIPLSADPFDTFENRISGPALDRTYGVSAKELSERHPAWSRVGETAAQLCLMLGLTHGVERVVVCGGVGGGASDLYRKHLLRAIDHYSEYGNSTQHTFLPVVSALHRTEADTFELHGAQGVVRDFTTRAV